MSNLGKKVSETINAQGVQSTQYTDWMTPRMVALPTEEGGFEVAEQTQSKWRCYGKIPYYKAGKFVKYKRSELDAFFEAHCVVEAAS